MLKKRVKYRLQIVLEQKEEARNQAAKDLAEKRATLTLEQKVEERLRIEFQLNRERRKEEVEAISGRTMKGKMEAKDAQRRCNYIKKLDALADSLKDKIEKQKEKVKLADREVVRALRKLVQASRDLQMIEKHKDNWNKKRKRKLDLLDQKDMNEIGNLMYSHGVKF